MNDLRAAMAITLIGSLIFAPLANAGATQEAQGVPDPGQVKQCIEELGEGAKVLVRLANGKEIRGRIQGIHLRNFSLISGRATSRNPRRLVEYNQVIGLNLSGAVDLSLAAPACVQFATQWPTKFAKSDWRNLQQLRAGRKIRVVQTNLRKVKGRFLAWTEEAITLRVKKQKLTIPREEVHRVTLLSKSKRGRNVLIGLGLGVLVGAATGTAVAVAPTRFHGNGLVFPIATFIGVGVGAGVGAAIPSHPTIYLAPREKNEEEQ